MAIKTLDRVWTADQEHENLASRRMSLAEYDALPETSEKIEWANGFAIWCERSDRGETVIAPVPAHGRIAARLCQEIGRTWPDAEVMVGAALAFSNRRRIPDLMVLAANPGEVQDIRTPPLVVVEILSPATMRQDLTTKADEYAAFGVAQYWIADPDDQALIVRENCAGAWRTVVVIDEGNPVAEVSVGGQVILLQHRRIFR